MEDNFLPQLGRDPAWESAPLGLFFVNRELLSDVMVGGFIGHSDHDRQFSTLRKVRRRVCRFATLVFQREILACLGNWLMESLGSSPEGQRGPGQLDILQEGNLKAQEQVVTMR